MIGKIKYLFILCFSLFLISCQNNSDSSFVANTSIIPKPQLTQLKAGYFETSKLIINRSSKFIDYIDFFENQFQNYSQKEGKFIKTGISENLIINITNEKSQSKGNYKLKVDEEKILIEGNQKGIFYGFQTLFQLILLNNKNLDASFKIPCVEIQDYSSFSHRGFLMDCCRHIFSVKTIKKYIDLLAFYKMNVFHWHLTEDQGWRIEIERYPKLNSIGSYRKDSTGFYGGFYTKNEIREIVNYAAERYIEIIPEIELPGHSTAAIASYPNLSCKQKTIEVANTWGVFKDIYCAGNDSVFLFLENVFEEIIDLFPSKRIHIGGDEAPKFRWQHCEKCQSRMKTENLSDEHELQSYFIERIAEILDKKNRSIIGWDEILESEITSQVSIQSWRGFSGGVEAVKQGKKAIMSPTSHCYFDYEIESIDLEKVYSFSPIPIGLDSIDQELIIGGECNLWSERIPNERELDYKSFPRLLAMSEVLWRNPKKNYLNFQKRVENHYPILDILNVNYGIESSPAIIKLEHAAKTHAVIETKAQNLNLFFHWGDDSLKPLINNRTVVNNSGILNIQAFKNQRKYGEVVQQKISIHRGIGKGVDYKNTFSEYYKSDGIKTLTDGKLGSLNFKDGNWQGFYGSNFEVVLNLDTIALLNSISINFYQYINSWIVIPKNIQLYQSSDQKKWTKVRSLEGFSEIKKRGKFIKEAVFKNLNIKSKFIKIIAENFKELPSWHEAAGSKCWIFTDEIIVR